MWTSGPKIRPLISVIMMLLIACGEDKTSEPVTAQGAGKAESPKGALSNVPDKDDNAATSSKKKTSTSSSKWKRKRPRAGSWVDENPIGLSLVGNLGGKSLSKPLCEVRLKGETSKFRVPFIRLPCGEVGQKVALTFSSNALESFKHNGKVLEVVGNKAQWSVDLALRGLRRTAKGGTLYVTDKGDDIEIVDGGQTYTGTVKCGACSHVIDGLCGKKPFEPVSFGLLDTQPNDVLALALCNTTGRIEQVIGTKKGRYSDIDYVIRVESKERSLSSCKYRSKSKGKMTLKRIVTDLKFDAYDRRTGEMVASRTVRPESPKCPSKVPSTYGDIRNRTSKKQREKAAWKILNKLRSAAKKDK